MTINSKRSPESLPLSLQQKKEIFYELNKSLCEIATIPDTPDTIWEAVIKGKMTDGSYKFEIPTRNRLAIVNLYTYTLILMYKNLESNTIKEEVANDLGIHTSHINPDEALHREDPQRLEMESIGVKMGPDYDGRPTIESLQEIIQTDILPLIDARKRLEKSKIVEFDTPEEIFFFILNLLDLNDFAAYLNSELEITREFPLSNSVTFAIGIIVEIIGNTELKDYADRKVNLGSTYINDKFLQDKFGLSLDDIQKIKLKQKES